MGRTSDLTRVLTTGSTKHTSGCPGMMFIHFSEENHTGNHVFRGFWWFLTDFSRSGASGAARPGPGDRRNTTWREGAL